MSWDRTAFLQLAAMAALLEPPKPRRMLTIDAFQPVDLNEMRLTVGLLAAMEPIDAPRPEDVKDELGYTPRQYAEDEWRDRRAQEKRQRRRERNLRIAQRTSKLPSKVRGGQE